MSINQRIKILRAHLKLDQKDFAAEIGISKQVLSNVEKDKNKPSYLLLESVFNRFKVNLNWLVSGEGEMDFKDKKKIIKGDGNITQVGTGQNNTQKMSIGELTAEHKHRLSLAEKEVGYLRGQVELLEKSVQDKEMIITMLKENIKKE